MKKYVEKEYGITLIALIITIIVMLILVTVALSVIINNDGLFNRVNNAVDIDVAAIFTILFPTNIVLNSLFESSVRFATNLAPFTPSSFICLILILLSDINDVSDAEKKPEAISSINNTIL